MIHLLVSLLTASGHWSWGSIFYPYFNSPVSLTGVVLATLLTPSPLPTFTFSQSSDLPLRMTQSVLLRSLATLKSIDLLVTASRQRQMTHMRVTQRECSTAGKMACVPAGRRGIWLSTLDPDLSLQALAALWPANWKTWCKSSSVCGERDCLAELYETSISGIPSKRLLLNDILINHHLFHAYTMVIGSMVSILPINYIFYSHNNVILPTLTTKTIASSYNSYFVPGPVLSTLHLLIHPFLTITLWYRNCCCPHITNEETGRERTYIGVPLNPIGSKWQSCDNNSGFWAQTLNFHTMLSLWNITIIHFTGEETAAQRGCSFIHSHTAIVIEIICLHFVSYSHCVLLSRLRRYSHQKAWYAWFSLALPIGTSQGPTLWLIGV